MGDREARGGGSVMGDSGKLGTIHALCREMR